MSLTSRDKPSPEEPYKWEGMAGSMGPWPLLHGLVPLRRVGSAQGLGAAPPHSGLCAHSANVRVAPGPARVPLPRAACT